ncbi:unnamed protein product [Vicia faba]|uniref:Uncharacterized protein n=1 Tax=Vicia faba TaxID=3906 RepID=A0AAV0Z563_VICFA|nr:unnamed protein product [Vicia faba]
MILMGIIAMPRQSAAVYSISTEEGSSWVSKIQSNLQVLPRLARISLSTANHLVSGLIISSIFRIRTGSLDFRCFFAVFEVRFSATTPRDSSSQLLTISSFSSMNMPVLLSPFLLGCPTLHNSNIIISLITPRTTILTRSASSKKKSSVSASRFSSQACCAALQADASFSSSPSPS